MLCTAAFQVVLGGTLVRTCSAGGKFVNGGSVRISLDWWAVLAAAAAVILIKMGLVAGIPW